MVACKCYLTKKKVQLFATTVAHIPVCVCEHHFCACMCMRVYVRKRENERFLSAGGTSVRRKWNFLQQSFQSDPNCIKTRFLG